MIFNSFRRRTLVVALSLLVVARLNDVAAAERPNFLFLYTDDQRWDALGVVQREQGEKARFPWLESPNLDRLAAEGYRFRNAFVVTSLCAPSRAAFLTGRYGHLNGIVNNHTPFPETSVTHASLLRAAGYRTGYVGKWHMGSQSGQRPGFDFSASFVGQGVFFDCPFEVNGVKTSSVGWVDDVSMEYARKFITESKDRPFSLVVGFKTCHGPFTPPERTATAYEGEQARDAPNLHVEAVYRQVEATAPQPKANGNKRPIAGKGLAKPGTNLGMFRGLRAIDENVGKLLALLDELGLADNTVVVYSSDNGYYLGEHGLGDKRSAYDEALRIPLLVRYPKFRRRGVTVDQMALNIDLAPTFLDLAGAPVPSEMQGRSWKPLLAGEPATDWRKAYFYSYFREGRSPTPTVTAVRTDAAKLIRYPGRDEWTEMFDLRNDPYETKNVFADASYAELRRTLEAEYVRQSQAVNYHVPKFADEKALPPEPKPLQAWVLDYQFKRDQGNRIVDASGHGNDGVAHGTTPVNASTAVAAGRRFDGKGHINVKNAPSLDPSVGPWTVEVTFVADAADGMILARGGQTNGYALYLVEGRPTFTYTTPEGRRTFAAKQATEGRRTTVVVRLSGAKHAEMTVDGQRVAEGRLSQWIAADPNDEMQIGDDLRSSVLETKVPAFRGTIERVRIFSGEAPSE
jgi:arylsulfatase A-like enzyme